MTAPTTRETADHIGEAANSHIRNLRLAGGRDFAVSGYSDGLIVEQDMRGMLLAAADALENLLSEIAALRGERTGDDHAAQAEVDEHAGKALDWEIIAGSWKDRATQAERQRDELRKALETIGEMAPATCETSLAHDMAQHANQALANQGADQ